MAGSETMPAISHGNGGVTGPRCKSRAAGSRRKGRTIDLAAIEMLDREDCIERWRQMFGTSPPKYTSLEFMRKALVYEAQVKAFGGHSNIVQRALKAGLKSVRCDDEADNCSNENIDAGVDAALASYPRSEAVFEKAVPYPPILDNQLVVGASNQVGTLSNNDAALVDIPHIRIKTKTGTATKPGRSVKPSVLSIRAGTHLVRVWNGRTYQVEALDKGFRLDGKTYRSLSAIVKKITGSHWSGPRFFGLES